MWSLSTASAQDLTGTVSGAVRLNLVLGSQFKAVNVGVSVYGTSTYKFISIEGGLNFNFTPFLQKFGVYQKDLSGTLEVFGLAGFGENDNQLGSTIGLTPGTAFYSEKGRRNRFYGIGQTVVFNRIKGGLHKFSNALGGLIIRVSDGDHSFTINSVNDASAKPFIQNGTDKGLTASMIIKYSTIRYHSLFAIGLGFDMFTPEADYSRTPRNIPNSEGGMSIVSFNTKPYDELFHFNLFVDALYQGKWANVNGRVGIDSPKLGAFVQNMAHDGVGLYPRFSWPVENKAHIYTLLNAGGNYRLTIE